MFSLRSVLCFTLLSGTLSISAQPISADVYGEKMNEYIKLENKPGSGLYHGEAGVMESRLSTSAQTISADVYGKK